MPRGGEPSLKLRNEGFFDLCDIRVYHPYASTVQFKHFFCIVQNTLFFLQRNGYVTAAEYIFVNGNDVVSSNREHILNKKCF